MYRDSHSGALAMGVFFASMTDSPEMYAYIVIICGCNNHFPMFAKSKRWIAMLHVLSTKEAQLATDVDRLEVMEMIIEPVWVYSWESALIALSELGTHIYFYREMYI